LRIDFEKRETSQTKGLNIFITRPITNEEGMATFSGNLAAKVLGVVSAKISMTNVRRIEA